MSTSKSSFAKKLEADPELDKLCGELAREIREASQDEEELVSIDPEGPSSAWGLVDGSKCACIQTHCLVISV